MDISPTTIALIATGSTLLGSLVPSLVALRMARLTKESEERKHHKEIVVKAAIENWKQVADLMTKGGLPGKMSPLDVFMVHMSELANVVFDPTTNADNLRARLAQVDKLTQVAVSTSKEMEPIKRS
jgi:hypothetical protein